MKHLLLVTFVITLQALSAVELDPMEASVRAKTNQPWFAQYMVGEPIVAGFPGESEVDRLERIRPWEDARFGLFLHWGPQKAGGEAVISDKVLSKFNPVKFDAEEWVLTAKELGFRYIVITSKHHSGFCIFDSAYTDHDIIDATPFKRDPLKELADACAKHDMLLGFYYSVWDLKHPDYTGEIGSPNYARYHQYMLDQTEELLTKYGSVVTLWLDGEWVNSWTVERAMEYRDHIRALQPEIMLVDRVGQRRVGDGDYGSSENFVPYIGENWSRPWESCQKFDGGWFWKGRDTSQSLNWALRNLFDTVSRGGNFLMNMGPTPEGLLPPVSVKKLKPLGQWLEANGECVYGTQRGPHYLLDWGTSTRRGNTLYYQVFDWPKDGTLIIPSLNAGKPNAGIQAISYLNHEASVSFEQVGQDVHVQLPSKPVDPLLTVLKVELTDEPIVNNAIRPLGKPLRPQTGNSKLRVGDYFLSAAFAKIHGDTLHFSLGSGAGAQRENLKGWTNPSDWAEWTLQVDEPGRYNVKVNYYSWMQSGRFAVEVAGHSFEHTVQAGKLKGKQSPLKAGPQSVTLGQVEFEAPGTYQLSVKALEITPEAIKYGQGLMGLKDVILERVQ
ncbi:MULTISPECIES: alpha-L-fucosidase [unclassified Lentimonas]|uniref:alpha-L-fucosidase n=1 Tax=unclassified Lentimonas TaxID=2630993 RepID=UPI00132510FF|nr:MULTISPECIES: alpha-L-fucosidase [unclassified Lentimonas]CAA6677576.1 Alpha-L-fucosidase (EC [Lentimonas sp. CC4]CAA6684327.1 Alpha-L-fucosidase (EC [Lentimonas sp. CC6]CAA7078155.1 Alpha-L-fucosidase (EC [Lentimonas sp. CC4]CAA7168327.1 Alpha-L-fucosidase (EC [Lentimonas sp. CC21]CAA7181840.1 Alpha-L-fucosidase (EC [Lentimonas sp. CC8]